MLREDGSKIMYSGKRSSYMRRVSDLSEDLQHTLKNHLKSLSEGREVMERFNFQEGETTICRGQPETEFRSLDPRNGGVTVWLLGHGHWQIFKGGARDKGTRYTENLQSTLLKVIVWDDEQLEA